MPRPYVRHTEIGEPISDGVQALRDRISNLESEKRLQVEENIRLTQRLAQQAEELTAMRNQLDLLTAKATTAADATQLLTTRTTNAAAEADTEKRLQSETITTLQQRLAEVTDQLNGAGHQLARLANAQRQIDAKDEELRLAKLENEPAAVCKASSRGAAVASTDACLLRELGEVPMSDDVIENIVMEHSKPLVGGPVPVLHAGDPKPTPPEQPKQPEPEQSQEVDVNVNVKPAQPAGKPDKD
jgi:hypothetical protein